VGRNSAKRSVDRELSVDFAHHCTSGGPLLKTPEHGKGQMGRHQRPFFDHVQAVAAAAHPGCRAINDSFKKFVLSRV
jgi:hypothetical protein